LLLSVSSLSAASPAGLHVDAGTLESAIFAIGTQANVTIGINDRSLRDVHVGAYRGSANVPNALRTILAGTRATFVEVSPSTFIIVARAPVRAQRIERPPVREEGVPIVVVGSKRRSTLSRYPGSVAIIDPSALEGNRPIQGSNALVEQMAVLSSTHLGPGRDKLFIRGIADSSFAGPTQATVGQYLGEVRLNYSAPDPNLALYDLRSIEVLEGPQGTLYGAGSLGGIIRLDPQPPDAAHNAAALDIGLTATAGGEIGHDIAGMVNLPIARDKVALRVVGYQTLDGGYIDDVGRNLSDVNRTITRGGRAALRISPSANWTIDVGGIVQDINMHDGQYAERGLGPLQRSSALAQPFDNDYQLASLVVRHTVGATSFVSATSFVDHIVTSTFDASTALVTPQAYQSTDRISLLTNETRMSRDMAGGGNWVVGLEALRNEDRLSRTLGQGSTAATISGTRNLVEEGSIFGEITLPIVHDLSFTGGGRLTYARLVSEVLDQPAAGEEPHRKGIAVLPSFGLLWRASGRLSVYARYQEGYRPGGLSVQSSSTQEFRPDSVATWELGIRRGDANDTLQFSAAASYAHWDNIQADLVDAAGFPFTANIGSGRIIALEATGTVRPGRGLSVSSSLFVNQSRLREPAAGFGGESDPSLPNIPTIIGRVGANVDLPIGGRALRLSASARYVGRSRLGVGTHLDLHQGNYFDTAAGIRMPLGRMTVSLDAANLLNERRNVFSLGNPFGVGQGRQITPLRPTSVRLGISTRF